VAFAIPRGGGESWNLTYWDLWFALIAEADFGGSLDRLAAHMKEKRRGGLAWGRDSLERMLAHLRDLQRRLLQAGIGVTDLVSKAGDMVKSEAKRARNQILDKPAAQGEWSEAMSHPPRQWRYARAMRGRWPQFPVSPQPYAD